MNDPYDDEEPQPWGGVVFAVIIVLIIYKYIN